MDTVSMYIRDKHIQKSPAVSFQPDFIAESVGEINFAYLRGLGVTTCFIDLDGTVVDRGTFEVAPALRQKLKDSGMDIKISTNRPKSRSLKELKQDLSATGVIHPKGLAGKPAKRYYLSALREYGLKPHEVVMIGDRFLQDIMGSNRAGIYSLAVFKLGRSKGYGDKILSAIEKWAIRRLCGRYFKAG